MKSQGKAFLKQGGRSPWDDENVQQKRKNSCKREEEVEDERGQGFKSKHQGWPFIPRSKRNIRVQIGVEMGRLDGLRWKNKVIHIWLVYFLSELYCQVKSWGEQVWEKKSEIILETKNTNILDKWLLSCTECPFIYFTEKIANSFLSYFLGRWLFKVQGYTWLQFISKNYFLPTWWSWKED